MNTRLVERLTELVELVVNERMVDFGLQNTPDWIQEEVRPLVECVLKEEMLVSDEEFGLSTHTVNLLLAGTRRKGGGGSAPIRTVGELAGKSEEYLLSIPGFGRVALAEVQGALTRIDT